MKEKTKDMYLYCLALERFCLKPVYFFKTAPVLFLGR